MQELIDVFANAYGWTKEHIFEDIYPQEIPYLLKRIMNREKLEIEHRIRGYMMSLQAYHCKDPKELFEELRNTLRLINRDVPDSNNDNTNNKPYYMVKECDKKSLEALKNMKQNIIDKNLRR